MKKIMFNKKYGLEQAVLEGRKTMTRRILKVPMEEYNDVRYALEDSVNGNANKNAILKKYSAYQVGEIVAVAQSYETIYDTMEEQEGNCKANEWWCSACDYVYSHQHNQFGLATTEGYRNKMFVLADLMPNKIKITDAKLELLQDISDEDCFREGIFIDPLGEGADIFAFDVIGKQTNRFWFPSARMAFAALIDKINGRGTWNNNPWVVAYTQKLMKE